MLSRCSLTISRGHISIKSFAPSIKVAGSSSCPRPRIGSGESAGGMGEENQSVPRRKETELTDQRASIASERTAACRYHNTDQGRGTRVNDFVGDRHVVQAGDRAKAAQSGKGHPCLCGRHSQSNPPTAWVRRKCLCNPIVSRTASAIHSPLVSAVDALALHLAPELAHIQLIVSALLRQ